MTGATISSMPFSSAAALEAREMIFARRARSRDAPPSASWLRSSSLGRRAGTRPTRPGFFARDIEQTRAIVLAEPFANEIVDVLDGDRLIAIHFFVDQTRAARKYVANNDSRSARSPASCIAETNDV